MSDLKRNGTIVVEGERASIRFERHLPYPVESVWEAIASPEHRAAWLGPTTLEPRIGGLLDMTSEGAPVPANMRRVTGRILKWEPPHLLEHEWHQPIIGSTVVRYELKADGAGTLLKFTHSGLRVNDAKGFIPGTHAYLDRLEAHLGGATLPVWTERYGQLKPVYESPR